MASDRNRPFIQLNSSCRSASQQTVSRATKIQYSDIEEREVRHGKRSLDSISGSAHHRCRWWRSRSLLRLLPSQARCKGHRPGARSNWQSSLLRKCRIDRAWSRAHQQARPCTPGPEIALSSTQSFICRSPVRPGAREVALVLSPDLHREAC